MRLTDDMVTTALGLDPEQLVGKRIIACHEIVDSDRRESLLVCDDGTCVLLSCDPTCHDDQGSPLPPDKHGERWEVVLYDATDSEAGRVVRNQKLEPRMADPERLLRLVDSGRQATSEEIGPCVLVDHAIWSELRALAERLCYREADRVQG